MQKTLLGPVSGPESKCGDNTAFFRPLKVLMIFLIKD